MQTTTTETPGSIVRRERRKRGLTQLALAVRAHCSITAVGMIERGGPLSRELASRIAAALGIPVDSLSPTGTEASDE